MTPIMRTPRLAPDAAPIAKVVHDLMVRRGLSQTALAVKSGLKSGYVRELLRGRSQNPSAAAMAKIAKTLDTSIEELERAAALQKLPEGEKADRDADLQSQLLEHRRINRTVLLTIWDGLDTEGQLRLLEFASAQIKHTKR